MKTRAITVYVTSVLSISSLILALSFSIFVCDYNNIGKSVGFAIFGSSLVALIISLVEYHVAKKITLEDFFLEYVTFLNKIGTLQFMLITNDERAYSQYLTNERMIWKFDESNKKEFISAIKKDFVKNKPWVEKFSYIETMEYFQNNASKFDDKLRKVLESYVDFSELSLDNLGRIYGSIFYLFKNKAKKQMIYDSLYFPALELKRTIKKEASHFADYIQGDGQNTYAMVCKLEDLFKNIFKIDKSGNVTKVYARAFNQLSEKLEKFRCEIYGAKYEERKYDPIYFSIRNE